MISKPLLRYIKLLKNGENIKFFKEEDPKKLRVDISSFTFRDEAERNRAFEAFAELDESKLPPCYLDITMKHLMMIKDRDVPYDNSIFEGLPRDVVVDIHSYNEEFMKGRDNRCEALFEYYKSKLFIAHSVVEDYIHFLEEDRDSRLKNIKES